MNNKLNKRNLTLEEEKDEVKGNVRSSNGMKYRKNKKWNFKGKKSNDPVWHGKNSQITKDLCSIPFNTMLGFPPKAQGTYKYMLGVLRSYFVDWFAGISDDFRSFLNSAATNLWEFIRSRNSGATNYQSGDIFINVILGCLDMFATARYIESFFTHVSMYSVYNRLIPKTMFEMRKIDFEDFVANIANYRGRFNLLIAKMSAVVVPDQFPIYHWVMSMFTDVYKDRDSETGREQLLIPVKQSFHIFDATADPNGGVVRLITAKDLGGTYAGAFLFRPETPKMKFSFLLDIFEKQINAIITDEDCNIIFGDLIKAYGSEGKFFKFAPQTEGSSLAPVYSEEFLVQFHNCVMPPSPVHGASETIDGVANVPIYSYENTVKQDSDGYLVTSFKYSLEYSAITPSDPKPIYYNDDNEFLLDTNEVNPSPEQIMTMTRWHNRYTIGAIDSSLTFYVQVSTASAVLIFNGEIAFVNEGNVVYAQVDQVFEAGNVPIEACILSNFDWSPICYVRSTTGSLYPTNAQYIFGDINNVQPVKRDTIARIHDVDFASLYDVPFSGKF